jgi:hypothetical protein
LIVILPSSICGDICAPACRALSSSAGIVVKGMNLIELTMLCRLLRVSLSYPLATAGKKSLLIGQQSDQQGRGIECFHVWDVDSWTKSYVAKNMQPKRQRTTMGLTGYFNNMNDKAVVPFFCVFFKKIKSWWITTTSSVYDK